MRIVEYGSIKPDIEFCTNCGCVFEYVNCDIKHIENISFVFCPVCKKVHLLKREERNNQND